MHSKLRFSRIKEFKSQCALLGKNACTKKTFISKLNGETLSGLVFSVVNGLQKSKMLQQSGNAYLNTLLSDATDRQDVRKWTLGFVANIRVGGVYLGFPWIIQSMIQTLKLFIRLTNGRAAWSMCQDGFRGGFMQECGRLWSVKLTERVSVNEWIICVAQTKIQLCDSNCLKQMHHYHLQAFLCLFPLTDHSSLLSFLFFFPPSLLTRWSQTLSRTSLSDQLASGCG